jgi:hypothetical protein
MNTLSDGINRQAPPELPNRDMELSKQERELIVKLRLLDFFRFNHGRKAIVEWNGARLTVFDTTQI